MPKAAASKRYVILPGYGVTGKAMHAAIFRDGNGSSLVHTLNASFWASDGSGVSRAIGSATATPALVDLAHQVVSEFSVLSQRFEDGPAVVAMSDAARLAFEAAYPDLRVLPITRYYLPGLAPKRSRAVPAGAHGAGESAVQADGQVYLADAKQHALASLDTAASQQGAGVVVGAIDTGIDDSHPALKRSISTSRCLIPGAPPTAGGPVDWGVAAAHQAGHGTHVAGIIAAEPGHGGPAGVAPGATLISYRVFRDNPGGPVPAENPVIIDSIRAAIDDGCHIVNLSLEGASLKEDGVRSAISDAWNQGVVCVAAAGNGWGLPVSYPAALPHCLAVTALGREGSFPARAPFDAQVSAERSAVDPKIFLAAFANFGPRVQFIAPGHAIVSTFPGGQWWFQSGTSMAAPFVSGVLARLLSDAPQVMAMVGDAQRSTAMMQLLVAHAAVLQMPQRAHEGYGLPL